MTKFLLGFSTAMFISFVATAIYLGYYKSVELEQAENISFDVLYIKHQGAYHTINESISKVESWAKENKVVCNKTFGNYLDDPKVVKDKNLRSEAGCVLSQELDNELKIPEEFSVKNIQIAKALKAHFSGSPALGPLKVYPKADEWFEEQQLRFKTSIEIYKLVDDKFQTEYIFPIEQQ